MGGISEQITALNMIHAYPTHVSAGYAIEEGMLMVRTGGSDDAEDAQAGVGSRP